MPTDYTSIREKYLPPKENCDLQLACRERDFVYDTKTKKHFFSKKDLACMRIIII